MNIEYRIVWQWLFSQPSIGACPPRVNAPLMARLLHDPIRPVVMARAESYFAAGCPLDLCETAACRDLWLALHNVPEVTDTNA